MSLLESRCQIGALRRRLSVQLLEQYPGLVSTCRVTSPASERRPWVSTQVKVRTHTKQYLPEVRRWVDSPRSRHPEKLSSSLRRFPGKEPETARRPQQVAFAPIGRLSE